MSEYIDKWQAVSNLMDAGLRDPQKAIDAIQFMDSADVRPVRWIPVKERLPEPDNLTGQDAERNLI